MYQLTRSQLSHNQKLLSLISDWQIFRCARPTLIIYLARSNKYLSLDENLKK